MSTEQTFVQTYGLEMSISLLVGGLLINVVLITKIKYGNTLITHLTLRPYYVTLVLLSMALVEAIYLEVTFGTSVIFTVLGSAVLDAKQLTALTLGASKYILIFIFIFVRTQEHEALLVFVFFQHNFRLESLNVARDSYKLLETRLAKGFFVLYTIFLAPFLIQLIVQWFTDFEILSKYSTCYVMCLLAGAITAYTSSVLKLM